MIRALLVLLVLASGLAYLDGHLEQRAAAERASRARVGRFVSADEAAGWKVACFEVADSSGNAALYLRYFGRWRCRSQEGAPVDTQALQALFDALTMSEGVVHAESPRDPQEYGIGTPTTWRVTFHGPAAQQEPHEDPIVSFDLGTPIPDRDACYVRRVGESRVWLLESNPRGALDAPAVAGLPPLLSPYVLPSDWPGWTAGLARVRVEERGQRPYVLEKRVPPPDPSVDPRQRPAYLWVLDPGLSESIAASLQSTAYTIFLQRIPFLDVRGPRQRTALGLDDVARTVVLEPAEGTALRLLVGRPLPDGRVPLWNEDTARAYLVTNEVGSLLIPPRSAFTTTSEENPWDPYLRR